MNFMQIFMNLMLPMLSIIIPVFATVYTVNKRIKEQNRANYQPYLVLDEITPIKQIDIYSYHLTLIGTNYQKIGKSMTEEELLKLQQGKNIYVNLGIKNIGYGVATNIKFYNLLTGSQIYGTQAIIKEKNQKLFTTFDIAKERAKNVQAVIINREKKENGISYDDHYRILCVYQDLNQNIYSFIIALNIKEKQYYDFFAYQPSSKSYNKWILENKKEYKKIFNDYKSF
ncbi:MAG TPA: hypothetical protein GX747_01810 [Tenericutes bacterium]|nr:hypothetical protein [Mycoplasmatota bacterium]